MSSVVYIAAHDTKQSLHRGKAQSVFALPHKKAEHKK